MFTFLCDPSIHYRCQGPPLFEDAGKNKATVGEADGHGSPHIADSVVGGEERGVRRVR